MKNCKQCQSSFEVADEDKVFYAKISPVFNDKKYLIPEPTLCPDCRQQRRMGWRNERFLFARKCSKTEKRIISMYPPNTVFPVYLNSEWWKDECDTTSYGQDIDWGQNIFAQIQNLQRIIPRMHAFKYADDRLINSEYTNCTGDLKDCYLVYASGRDEKCLYCSYINDCYECLDCFFVIDCQLCYECLDCKKCNRLKYGINCSECHDSYFLQDCRGCTDCIGCIGLRNKKYNILNKQYPKEEYDEIKADYLKNNRLFSKDFQIKYKKLIESIPRKYIHGENFENCTGDYIWNSQNCHNCFDVNDARDCKYCTWFEKGRDCMDYYSWGEAELCYEISGGGQDMYQCAFTAMSYGCKNSYYLDLCVYSKNCFACVGLKNKEYCILNKQYSKEEYEKLVPKIIEYMKSTGEYGEFFPLAISPVNYNESVAQDYYPLRKNEVIKSAFNWSDYEQDKLKAEKIIPANRIPDHINDVPDDILSWAIECQVTHRLFKIQPRELNFYRKHYLPMPHLHPDERHKKRVSMRNPRKLWERNCDKCQKEIQSTYSSQRPEKVYCDECYLKEVY